MINIRKAEAKDIDEIINIENASFSTPWSRSSFEDDFDNEYIDFYVAEDEEKLIGYASIGLIIPDAEILNIAVDEKYRRQGIGEMLFDTLMNCAYKKEVSDLFLEVRESNEPALELYSKKGFNVLGRRKNYYKLPEEDAIMMHYKLASGELLC